jgi:seryl-tRNA synthetase
MPAEARRPRDAAGIVAGLRARGELWEAAEGLVGLRGAALALQRTIAARIAAHARESSDEEWQVPAGIGLPSLARAGVFASFPQWLTAAAHLSSQPGSLEAVASAADPASAAAAAFAPAGAALPSAACWHCYAALAGERLPATRRITLEATCWRHEAGRFAPLERGWAFTMREVVCLGEVAQVSGFLEEQLTAAEELARSLGLHAEIAWAEDPFFAPTSRGRALLQRLKGLKRELLLPLGDGRRLAVFSANQHEAFFGDAFDVRLASGQPAWSACAAFGLERWLLAFLVEHGLDERDWPKEVAP